MVGVQTVWSIDVGKSSLKAVKVQRERNHLEIVAVDKINYPVEASGIDSLHQAKEAIRTFAARHAFNSPVIVSHPGHSAFSRFIQLPPVDAKKLVEMVGYEAQQQIPFPIAEVRWGYHVCAPAEGSDERNVGIFAVRSEVITDFTQDYESVGVPVAMISIGYLGLLNYVLYDVRPEKPCVVIDIGSDHTDLLVVDGKRFWVRNLAIAGNDVTQALMEKFKLNFEEAEKLKLSASKSDQAVKIFGVVQPTLKDLVNEIHRSVGFYKSQAGDVKFEDIYVFGNSSRLVGIQKYLQEHLRFHVHVEKGFHRIRVNREANVALLQQDFPSFAPCVGHAIQALGEGECTINLLPKEKQEALEFRKKQFVVLAAAAFTYVLIFILMFSYGDKRKQAADVLELMKPTEQIRKQEQSLKDFDLQLAGLKEEEKKLLHLFENRLEPYQAMQLLAETFNTLPNQEQVVVTLDKRDYDEKRGEIETNQEEKSAAKIWLTLARVEKVYLGPDGRPADRRPVAGAQVVETIPAYDVTVNAITYVRDTTELTQNHVDQLVRSKLEKELTDRFGESPAADKKWVRLQPADSEPNLIYTRGRYSTGRLEKENELKQGELSEFKLQWYQYKGPLPEKPAPPAEPEKKKAPEPKKDKPPK